MAKPDFIRIQLPGAGSSITYPDLDSGGHNYFETFEYDANGNLISYTDRSNNTTGYVYDNEGRLLSLTPPGGGETVFTYDINGNILSRTDPDSTVTYYKYDNLGRMAESKKTIPTAQSFIATNMLTTS